MIQQLLSLLPRQIDSLALAIAIAAALWAACSGWGDRDSAGP